VKNHVFMQETRERLITIPIDQVLCPLLKIRVELSDPQPVSTEERRETFHNSKARTTERKLTEISSPRRLRVKGTDTDSPMGCRIESGETGVQVSDGSASDGLSAIANGPQMLTRQQCLRDKFTRHIFPDSKPLALSVFSPTFLPQIPDVGGGYGGVLVTSSGLLGVGRSARAGCLARRRLSRELDRSRVCRPGTSLPLRAGQLHDVRAPSRPGLAAYRRTPRATARPLLFAILCSEHGPNTSLKKAATVRAAAQAVSLPASPKGITRGRF
jgi:hypothetical protein